MSSPLTGIGQLHITVSDLETSVAFYRDVLGLPHLFTVEGQPMAFFQAGSVRLYLGETPDERPAGRFGWSDGHVEADRHPGVDVAGDLAELQ
jgi:catechol 2,3-dioxygenase-like lactoylglutathione lyase family enzyme